MRHDRRPSPTASALLALIVPLALAACGDDPAAPGKAAGALERDEADAGVTRQPFGSTPDGAAVELFTLTNAGGMQVQATNYGGIVTSIRTPDRAGELAEVTLGHDSLEGYLPNGPYFGAIVGRYANRIGGARFSLEGRTYELPANDGPNTLHGGKKGFDQAVWSAEPFERPGEAGVIFSHTSPDGDQGFPGALHVRVVYSLTDRNELSFEFHATTDRATVVNLTQHAYFNLAGAGVGDVLGHRLMINADRYTPVDAALIPTGELASVEGTPFDFRVAHALGERINADHPQLRLGGGYDHNFVLNRGAASASGGELVLAARVEEPSTGRYMEVHTTQPGMQLYTGNHLDGSIIGRSGRPYRARGGFCLETQHFPDSPNKPSFPSTTLRPGEEFRSKTVYVFGAQDR